MQAPAQHSELNQRPLNTFLELKSCLSDFTLEIRKVIIFLFCNFSQTITIPCNWGKKGSIWAEISYREKYFPRTSLIFLCKTCLLRVYFIFTQNIRKKVNFCSGRTKVHHAFTRVSSLSDMLPSSCVVGMYPVLHLWSVILLRSASKIADRVTVIWQNYYMSVRC